MRFHHIGVATADIKKSIEIYERLGFMSGNIIFDPIQKVNICFLKKKDHPDIELIEPASETSPVHNILNKVGTMPYHLCYTTDNINDELISLKTNSFIIIVKPIEAVALNDKKVCFCYNKDFGLIELLES